MGVKVLELHHQLHQVGACRCVATTRKPVSGLS